MRLTLRTLLAYMDKVLNLQDQQALKEQIEASDLASELLHRTGDVVLRPQVGAPEVLGVGPVDDPNTMAEYLDNTLPEPNIAEFERACLESEVMLAEAASTHHVLAMVLGVPAEVDPDTRQRMQALPETLRDTERLRIESAHPDTETPKADEPIREATRPDAGVLGMDRSAAWRWAPAVASLLLLMATAYLMFGPAENDVADREAETAETGEELSDLPDDIDSPVKLENGEEEPSQSGTDGTGTDETSEEENPEETHPSPPEQPALPPELPEELPTVDLTVEPDDSVELPGEVTSVPTPDPAETSDPLSTPDPVPMESLYLPTESSLLVIEQTPDAWARAVEGSNLPTGLRLVSLPSYRSSLRLGGIAQIELVSFSEVILGDREGGKPPEIELIHGRFVVEGISEESPVELMMVINNARCRVTIMPGASLAVEVDRAFVPGMDLLNTSPPVVAHVFAPEGKVEWKAGGGVYGSDQPKQWGLTASGEASEPSAYTVDPGWIEGGTSSNPWDRRAAPLLTKRIAPDSEVWPQLRTAIDSDAYKEVRSLASHCGVAVGYPDPLIASFADESQQALWFTNLQTLRGSASRSKIAAERIRNVMVEQYGEELSADLFAMLCGFGAEELGRTPKELQRGALSQIIIWLESESLACRVLATLNLEELTGHVAVFSPTDPTNRRRQVIKKFRKRLQSNDLGLKIEN